jgi:histidinol phosphatase-like PHP family hydrolase
VTGAVPGDAPWSGADAGDGRWRPFDCHAHTTFSDGALAPAELVEIVVSRGVRPSISDHASRVSSTTLGSADALRVYLDALAPLEVGRSAEFDWHDTLWRDLPDDVVRRFTHRIGSLHAIALDDGTLINMWTRSLPDGITPDAYMDAHVVALEQFAREMPVDILAHPTLLPSPYRSLPLEELWTEAREARAARALAGAGIAFEVSNRYRPHRRFVETAAAEGARLSLGSDGHNAEQVGDLAFPLALTREIGVRDQDLYDPAVHGRR